MDAVRHWFMNRYKLLSMIKVLLIILIFSYGAFASASGVPSEILVTEQNSDDLNVSVRELNSGVVETSLYQLSFPKIHSSCAAGRVQTFLLKDSDEISSSSMDYVVGSNNPSVLFHIPASGYDMALSIQYCCGKGPAPGCKNMLSIQSIKELL